MKSFIALSVLLLVGYVLRSRLRILRWLYLPSCVIAGLLGLIILQVEPYIAPHIGWEIPTDWTLGWSKLPGILINVVFACLFLGVPIPGIKKVWRRAGPQLAYGQVVAWGQYVVGIGIFLALIQFVWPELPAMFGGILPVGFEGGHGTASRTVTVSPGTWSSATLSFKWKTNHKFDADDVFWVVVNDGSDHTVFTYDGAANQTWTPETINLATYGVQVNAATSLTLIFKTDMDGGGRHVVWIDDVVLTVQP